MRLAAVVSRTLAALLALAACGKDSTPTETHVATTLELVTAPTLTATAGLPLAVAPSFVVKDQKGNPMAGVPVTVAVTGGSGTLANAATVSKAGATPVGAWTLGPATGANTLTITVNGLPPVTVTATGMAGVIATVAILGGDGQSGYGGSTLQSPITLRAVDQFNNPTSSDQPATVDVISGNGTVAATTVQPSADGTITLPQWTLGRYALPQRLLVTVAGKSTSVNASVISSYQMDVRFFGAPMTAAQQALFTTAAARIRALIVGPMPGIVVQTSDSVDLTDYCDVPGNHILNEVVRGIVIYASVDSIDGPGKTLAEAGPCVLTRLNGTYNYKIRSVVGIMKFDKADLQSLTSGGNLQDVITHEMLHAVGVGVYWDPALDSLLVDKDLPTVGYTGAEGIAGCRAVGGVTSCASTVPVENVGGPATVNAHWRESVFGNELMTGYLNNGANPLSLMTVRSLTDLGFGVNTLAADPYTIAAGSLRASLMLGASSTAPWERARTPRTISLPIVRVPR